MFVALALILLAVAGFTVVVVRRRPPGGRSQLDADRLHGLAYVGCGALAALALIVLVVGAFTPDRGYAEGLAVLGFFAYALYGALALGWGYLARRRAARSATRSAARSR